MQQEVRVNHLQGVNVLSLTPGSRARAVSTPFCVSQSFLLLNQEILGRMTSICHCDSVFVNDTDKCCVQ